MNLNKHIWEGWCVKDFIEELEVILPYAIHTIKTRAELKTWCIDNQPYYKKYIPEVVNFLANKYNIE